MPSMNVLISGAAGFLGSHLADALLAQGHRVTGIDSLITGSRENVAHLPGKPPLKLLFADLLHPLPAEVLNQKWDRIWHLASPASPVGYVKHQIVTLKVNALATMSLMALAERTKARIFVASTSECYGDPLEHPQRESYWGHVNTVGMRSMYDEAKRLLEAGNLG